MNITTKRVFRPIGMGTALKGREKRWLQFALAGAGLASSLIGGAKASKAAREAEKRQRQREAEEAAWHRRRYNEDYIDTAAGQNLVRRAKEYAQQNWKRAQGAQAVAGGTEAATAMAKEAGNKMVGDTIANISAQDTARKDRVDAIHQQNRERFSQMDMQREQQRAQSITEAAQGASNAMLSAASALDQNSAPKNLGGGSNNSTSFDNTPTLPDAGKTMNYGKVARLTKNGPVEGDVASVFNGMQTRDVHKIIAGG